ncbi:DUF1707 domain-containing protein [Streptomyces sp. DSM 44915]|uniref:DUF1707 domain-containing protein n=1 Tax=Streptomyces chisholmiae TaxID=3075540 RepID=A0ABU2JKZ7_9ACTN|nr:DUF1707 domain-containing protein [Streptomyces sp. DSM 44915]MDT0265408.1 DUF1707 domain-containing protein [Streptomyces sp. DSM 44915]
MKAEKPPAVSLQKPSAPESSAVAGAAAVPAAGSPPVAPLAQGPKEVRASDADRDRIADILREALAEGRLEPDEHAERLDALYSSKTMGALESLISDLPAGQREAAPSPAAPPPAPPGGHRHGGVRSVGAKNVVAILSGASRAGTWRVGDKVNAVAVCGGVELDFTEALFESQYLTITVTAICGGVEIKVPENVTLRGGGSGIMGGFEVREMEAADPRAPVITVQGVAIMGGVEVHTVRGKRLRDLSGG